MPDNQDTALITYEAPRAMTIIRPLVDSNAARDIIEQFETLKKAIARPGDAVVDNKGRVFLKKTFWRRVANFFGLSVEIVREERMVEDNGNIRYSVIARATAPNGQFMDGDGLCDLREFGPNEHNTRAKAATRAMNRAISNLVGGGEVSADELPEAPASPRKAAPAIIRPTPKVHQVPSQENSGFAALRDRGLKAGIKTMEAWEDVCQEIAGAVKPEQMTDEGKRALVAYIEQLEREHTPNAENDYDLSKLAVPGSRA